jgi:hypothetical protein
MKPGELSFALSITSKHKEVIMPEDEAKPKGFIDFVLEASMDPVLGRAFLKAETEEQLQALFKETKFLVPERKECANILNARNNLADILKMEPPDDSAKY